MKSEQILDISAKRNMREWSLKSFKKTHYHLFKTIIEAIDSVKKHRPVFIDENKNAPLEIRIDVFPPTHPIGGFTGVVYFNDEWFTEVGGLSNVNELMDAISHSLNKDEDFDFEKLKREVNEKLY